MGELESQKAEILVLDLDILWANLKYLVLRILAIPFSNLNLEVKETFCTFRISNFGTLREFCKFRRKKKSDGTLRSDLG
jgi:hypothetical protein